MNRFLRWIFTLCIAYPVVWIWLGVRVSGLAESVLVFYVTDLYYLNLNSTFIVYLNVYQFRDLLLGSSAPA